MNTILIVSETEQIDRSLAEALAADYNVLQSFCGFTDYPDLILIAAQKDFSFFFAAKEQLHRDCPKIPMLFLWIESDCLHILSCSNLQYMNGKTIPRSQGSLLEYLDSSLSHANRGNLSQRQRLTDIQSDIRNHYPQPPHGAIQVEYDNFASIFQFVEQLAARSGQEVQTLLLSLLPVSEGAGNSSQLRIAMLLLQSAIQQTLRRNDVLTSCSDSQILVLLMDTDDDGGHLAANRIFNTFLGLYDGDNYRLQYDIRPIGTKF